MGEDSDWLRTVLEQAKTAKGEPLFYTLTFRMSIVSETERSSKGVVVDGSQPLNLISRTANDRRAWEIYSRRSRI